MFVAIQSLATVMSVAGGNVRFGNENTKLSALAEPAIATVAMVARRRFFMGFIFLKGRNVKISKLYSSVYK